MSTETISSRPIFGSEEQNLLTPNRPPLSRVALFSFVFGLISFVALFNMDLVALPILAATAGLAAYVLTAKNDGVSGQSLALIGMGLGVAFATASYTSTKMRNQYLYQEGAKVAEQFLKVVGRNKLLEAFELTLTEPERQVAGTSLEEFYQKSAPSARESVDGFRTQASVLSIVELGPSAQWKFHSGLRVVEIEGQSVHVQVRMQDQKSGKTFDVMLARIYLAGIGAWHVISVK